MNIQKLLNNNCSSSSSPDNNNNNMETSFNRDCINNNNNNNENFASCLSNIKDNNDMLNTFLFSSQTTERVEFGCPHFDFVLSFPILSQTSVSDITNGNIYPKECKEIACDGRVVTRTRYFRMRKKIVTKKTVRVLEVRPKHSHTKNGIVDYNDPNLQAHLRSILQRLNNNIE